jgi:hypothetical protein
MLASYVRRTVPYAPLGPDDAVASGVNTAPRSVLVCESCTWHCALPLRERGSDPTKQISPRQAKAAHQVPEARV